MAGTDLMARIVQAAEEQGSSSAVVLDEIKALVEEGAALEETIESLNEALKENNGRYNRIKQYLLPEKMKLAGLANFQTMDKTVKIKLDDYVSGSLPKDEHDREAAIDYLIARGGQELIKSDITVTAGKSEHNMAMLLLGVIVEKCKELGLEEPQMKEGVHAASLQSFVRGCVKKGEDIDYEKLGCYVGQICKFEFFGPDGKKKKKKATEDV
jgi:hypothetical protein